MATTTDQIGNSEAPENYFNSYDDINVHNLMLRDEPRVTKYRDAILGSKNIFKDKIVLDVGSGTGLLSIFCAQAGAKHVFAVEAALGISELSKAIIASNNLSSTITVINNELEKIERLSAEIDQVDIIVSEWMGVYLVHESMFNSVIYARDKWLRKDGKGLMYPSLAYLYVAPVEMTDYLKDNLNYWTNYHGLNFEPLMKVYKQLHLEKPVVEEISVKQVIDDEKILATFDLNTVTLNDMKVIQCCDLRFNASRESKLHGIAFWFDVIFATDNDIVTLGTGPKDKPTHWKQTVVFFPEALKEQQQETEENILSLSEDEPFECYVILNQLETNTRHYEIDIGVNMVSASKQQQQHSFDPNSDDSYDDSDEEDDGEEHPVPCGCAKMRCVLIKATLESYERQAAEKDTN